MANRKLQMTLNGQAVGPVEVAEDLPMIDYRTNTRTSPARAWAVARASAMPAW